MKLIPGITLSLALSLFSVSSKAYELEDGTATYPAEYYSSPESCEQAGGIWRSRTRYCEFPTDNHPDDVEIIYSCVNGVLVDGSTIEAPNVMTSLQRALGGPQLRGLGLDAKRRVIAIYLVNKGEIYSTEAAAPSSLLIVDEKTFQLAQIGDLAPTGGATVEFYPAGVQAPLSKETIAALRQSLLDITGAEDVGLTVTKQGVLFTPAGE